eukprot:15694-Amphidinium_carterae.1
MASHNKEALGGKPAASVTKSYAVKQKYARSMSTTQCDMETISKIPGKNVFAYFGVGHAECKVFVPHGAFASAKLGAAERSLEHAYSKVRNPMHLGQ